MGIYLKGVLISYKWLDSALQGLKKYIKSEVKIRKFTRTTNIFVTVQRRLKVDYIYICMYVVHIQSKLKVEWTIRAVTACVSYQSNAIQQGTRTGVQISFEYKKKKQKMQCCNRLLYVSQNRRRKCRIWTKSVYKIQLFTIIYLIVNSWCLSSRTYLYMLSISYNMFWWEITYVHV